MRLLILVIAFFVSAIATNQLLDNSGSDSSEAKVLSEFIEVEPTISVTNSPTPTLTSTPTPTLTPTPTPIPTPTLSPTPTPIPQPEFSSEQVHGFIERFAGQYAVDPNVLRALAICESGFRAKAVNGPYWGLFQFSANTWKNNRISMGEDPETSLRFNAEEATQTAAYMLAQGKGYAWPNCNP